MKGKKFWITEIILSFFRFCFFFVGLAGAFMMTVFLILLIAFTSNEMERVRRSLGIDEANQRDWERMNEKMKNPDKGSVFL